MSLIWWIRRDLRLEDNTALAEAIRHSGGQVLPLFILDPALLGLGAVGAARVHFLLESLHELDRLLREHGGRLILRRGAALPVLLELLRASGAAGVFFNKDYTPRALSRDAEVSQELQAQGFLVRSFKDQVLFEESELLSAAGKPYTVYTPYWRTWRARVDSDSTLFANRLAQAGLQLQTPAQIESIALPSLSELGFHLSQTPIPAGARVAHNTLQSFIERNSTGILEYAENRNRLDLEGTSRLAPHLRWGTVSVRACVRAALAARASASTEAARKGCESWLGELAWRDFYQQILFHEPRVLHEPFRREFRNFRYEHNPAHFAAWAAGQTGYPVVDAAMRQLNREAFMHNRARMIVASFLTKDLLLDYRLGERYFLQQLACGDLAANNGGWQWTAGCGNDAQPFFRIFNPVSQGQKFDPDGTYIRRYLPELARLPTAAIHEPWKLSPAEQAHYGIRIGRDYPAPIVDHATQRAEALKRYQALRG